MPEKPLEIGDLVQLMSGGPIMTITGLDKDQAGDPVEARTQWFGPNDELKTEYFPPAALKPTEHT